MSESSHSSSTLTSSSLGLERPIVSADLSGWVSSGGTSLLLLVPVLLSTIARQGVRLVASFSLSLSSLGLNTSCRR